MFLTYGVKGSARQSILDRRMRVVAGALPEVHYREVAIKMHLSTGDDPWPPQTEELVNCYL